MVRLCFLTIMSLKAKANARRGVSDLFTPKTTLVATATVTGMDIASGAHRGVGRPILTYQDGHGNYQNRASRTDLNILRADMKAFRGDVDVNSVMNDYTVSTIGTGGERGPYSVPREDRGDFRGGSAISSS
ncbi:hypothetical protein D9757_005074 [Collybiopsis confluens]|uniref:Uncharacterized protein n=1 Tax=Collybiopsis confluens TaxID=2823264 RepID=A0A8H5HSV4_9AGAR|nr:hypothetical protein D9757_005074 [Collybiopsis confluens]